METRDDEPSIRRRSATSRPRRRTPAQLRIPAATRPRIAALAGVLTLSLGLVIAWAPWDSTVTMHGSLTLAPGAYAPDGTSCTGGIGYDDISAGRAVTIGDQTGATIAVGQLQPGRLITSSNGLGACVFDFDVPVPSGRSLYTVTVSHRGTQTFSPSQLQQANLILGADAIANSLG